MEANSQRHTMMRIAPDCCRTVLRSTLLAACLIASGCPLSDEPDAPPVNTTDADNDSAAAAQPPAVPQHPAGVCRVYTAEPGYAVFVDGLPVRDDAGEYVRTPCAVTAAPGTHTVSVVRDGERDLSRTVAFGDDGEVVFEKTGPAGEQSALLNAPLLNAVPGEPIPLEAVNTARRELDPYVSPDGRSLWFVGDRFEGRGIYVATRGGPLEEFGQPQLLAMTRGADLPATPSLTADGTSVVYVVPDKTRIWSLTRSSPLADFDERNPLFYRDVRDVDWTSCQIHGDGLRIYFARESGGERETRVVIRKTLAADFSTELVFDMPGVHPCLSSDGLRQYSFDGKTLTRSRRESVRSRFFAPETIATLSLENYRHSPRRRQYWVSEDEQWMFYCDDPQAVAGGDLYVVRLSLGPAWGVALRGEPIEARVIAATPMPVRREPEPEPADDPAPNEPVDPRTLPLAYTKLREELIALVAARDFDAVVTRIETARSEPELETARELLGWDAADAARLTDFWQAVERAASELKAGDRFRDGSLRLEFVRFADGVLTGKTSTREFERPLAELDAMSLVDLADRVFDEANEDDHLRAATFLAYDPDGPATIRDRRSKEAGAGGAEFAERLAQRVVQQAEWELSRDNLSHAVEFINQALDEFPGSEAAAAAEALREQLYTRYAWQRRGSRQWETGPQGEFTAAPQRAENAVLLSPREYSRFELTMEYRTSGRNGQGGVFFRYPGSGAFYNRCFKIQLSSDRGVNPDEYCTGSIFGIEAPLVNAARESGQWQTFRMVVDGEELKVWINNRLVLDTTAIDDQIPEAGYVALDGIPGGISYRKVLVSGEREVED